MYFIQEIGYKTLCKTSKKSFRDSNRDLIPVINHLYYFGILGRWEYSSMNGHEVYKVG